MKRNSRNTTLNLTTLENRDTPSVVVANPTLTPVAFNPIALSRELPVAPTAGSGTAQSRLPQLTMTITDGTIDRSVSGDTMTIVLTRTGNLDHQMVVRFRVDTQVSELAFQVAGGRLTGRDLIFNSGSDTLTLTISTRMNESGVFQASRTLMLQLLESANYTIQGNPNALLEFVANGNPSLNFEVNPETPIVVIETVDQERNTGNWNNLIIDLNSLPFSAQNSSTLVNLGPYIALPLNGEGFPTLQPAVRRFDTAVFTPISPAVVVRKS